MPGAGKPSRLPSDCAACPTSQRAAGSRKIIEAMYLGHFGLRESPFRLTPDTAFFFPGSSHQEALNMLLVALAEGEGFLKLTGEIGLGKTLLCRTLLSRLGPEFFTAWIPNPDQSPASMRASLARELGIEMAGNAGQDRAIRLITDRLVELVASGRKPVLLIDEAQALPKATLEAVRLLTNIETEQRKLLQVVLLGQTELDHRLAREDLRQLRQRISFSHRLQAFDRRAVEHYVRHRLRVAGHGTGDLFDDASMRLLASASRGVPRLINILAHKALLSAFGRGLPRADITDMRRAVADTESVETGRSSHGKWLRLAALVVSVSLVGAWVMGAVG